MADKVNPTPTLSKPSNLLSVQGLSNYAIDLFRGLFNELTSHATRLNLSILSDGSEKMTEPLLLSYTDTAALPTASDWEGGIIYVSNESGGAVPAFSDGTNWRRVTDRTIVS